MNRDTTYQRQEPQALWLVLIVSFVVCVLALVLPYPNGPMTEKFWYAGFAIRVNIWIAVATAAIVTIRAELPPEQRQQNDDERSARLFTSVAIKTYLCLAVIPLAIFAWNMS